MLTPLSPTETQALLAPVANAPAYLREYFEAFLKMGHTLTMFKLQRGFYWPGAARPADIREGEPRECFKNAGLLALESDGRYTYVEGWAIPPKGFPVDHAWCLDENGAIVDTTWPDAERSHYVGIPMSEEFLSTTVLKRGVWGVFGDFTKVNVLETSIAEMVAAPWCDAVAERPPCQTLDTFIAEAGGRQRDREHGRAPAGG